MPPVRRKRRLREACPYARAEGTGPWYLCVPAVCGDGTDVQWLEGAALTTKKKNERRELPPAHMISRHSSRAATVHATVYTDGSGNGSYGVFWGVDDPRNRAVRRPGTNNNNEVRSLVTAASRVDWY